jgi:hypothetical protein
MTLAAKFTYLSALLIGLSVGLILGFRHRLNGLESYDEARLITAPLELRDFSQLQYMHADSENAKSALLAYAGVLEAMEEARAAKTHKFELSLTYTRLALLEDQGNNPEQFHEYMTKARYWNSALGNRDYSESELKAALMRIDGQQ